MEKSTTASGKTTCTMATVGQSASLGTYTYTDGSKYEGQWKDNKKEGNGMRPQ